MADIKISALTALTGANVDQALDVIPVVDTSVTTTKKMTFAEFFTNRTLVTPTLGVAAATSINKVAFTAPATSATLTLADGKTLTCSNTLTFTGTDASSVAFGAGGTVLYSGGALGTPSGGTLTNCTGLPIAGTTGYGAGVATWLATASSANLYSAMTTKTGSGGSLVFATGPTISALTTSGISTSDGAQVLTANAMGALAIDVTKGLNTKSVSANSTFTFSGTPATTNTVFQLAISNGGATARTMTLPAGCLNADTLASATTAILPASGALTLTFRYDGTNYLTWGIPSPSIALGTAGVVAGSAVFSNTTSGAITVSPVAGALGTVTLTLPANPKGGTRVGWADVKANFATYNLTVNLNSRLYAAAATAIVENANNANKIVWFNPETGNWVLEADATIDATCVYPDSISGYLPEMLAVHAVSEYGGEVRQEVIARALEGREAFARVLGRKGRNQANAPLTASNMRAA